MMLFHKRQNSFVVRIWREQTGPLGERRSAWRGWVQHSSSGEETYVQNLRELLSFIERWTGSLAPPDEPSWPMDSE